VGGVVKGIRLGIRMGHRALVRLLRWWARCVYRVCPGVYPEEKEMAGRCGGGLRGYTGIQVYSTNHTSLAYARPCASSSREENRRLPYTVYTCIPTRKESAKHVSGETEESAHPLPHQVAPFGRRLCDRKRVCDSWSHRSSSSSLEEVLACHLMRAPVNDANVACGDARGSDRGFQRHERVFEDPCTPCRLAYNAKHAAFQRSPKGRANDRRARKRARAAWAWVKQNFPDVAQRLDEEARA